MVNIHPSPLMGNLGLAHTRPNTVELSTLLHCITCSLENTCLHHKGLSVYGDKFKDINQLQFEDMLDQVKETKEDLNDIRKHVTTLSSGVTPELAIELDELLYDMVEHIHVALYKLMHHSNPEVLHNILHDTCRELCHKFNGFIKNHRNVIEYADRIMLEE